MTDQEHAAALPSHPSTHQSLPSGPSAKRAEVIAARIFSTDQSQPLVDGRHLINSFSRDDLRQVCQLLNLHMLTPDGQPIRYKHEWVDLLYLERSKRMAQRDQTWTDVETNLAESRGQQVLRRIALIPDDLPLVQCRDLIDLFDRDDLRRAFAELQATPVGRHIKKKKMVDVLSEKRRRWVEEVRASLSTDTSPDAFSLSFRSEAERGKSFQESAKEALAKTSSPSTSVQESPEEESTSASDVLKTIASLPSTLDESVCRSRVESFHRDDLVAACHDLDLDAVKENGRRQSKKTLVQLLLQKRREWMTNASTKDMEKEEEGNTLPVSLDDSREVDSTASALFTDTTDETPASIVTPVEPLQERETNVPTLSSDEPQECPQQNGKEANEMGQLETLRMRAATVKKVFQAVRAARKSGCSTDILHRLEESAAEYAEELIGGLRRDVGVGRPSRKRPRRDS